MSQTQDIATDLAEHEDDPSQLAEAVGLTPEYDPTPLCHLCGAMEQAGCDCLPIVDNN